MCIFSRTSIITSTKLYLYRFYFDIPLKSIALFTCFTLDSIQSLSFGWQSNNRTLTDWQWLDTLWQPRAGEVKEKKYLCTPFVKTFYYHPFAWFDLVYPCLGLWGGPTTTISACFSFLTTIADHETRAVRYIKQFRWWWAYDYIIILGDHRWCCQVY